jgi:hypothetical protein
MLDGHVELLDLEQMKDMRRWSNQAGQANNRDWKLGESDEPSPTSPSDTISTGGSIDTGEPIDATLTNTNP